MAFLSEFGEHLVGAAPWPEEGDVRQSQWQQRGEGIAVGVVVMVYHDGDRMIVRRESRRAQAKEF